MTGMTRILAALTLACATASAGAQAIDLHALADPSRAHINNRAVTVHQEAGRTVLSFDDRPGGGYTWIPGTTLQGGDIDFDVRGRDSLQASFVGVAFRITSDSTLDINNAATPSLDVAELTARTGGGIGLFVGDKSNGDFANVRVTAAKAP
jgi:hypothetical protein